VFCSPCKIRFFTYRSHFKTGELAERGVIVTQKQEERLNHYHDELNKTNGPNSVLSKVYKEKDTIKYPASSYIEKDFKKWDEFYKGETAKTLVRYLQKKEQ
jgi:gamma-glutamyltranspeptidase/glutathione hydrolase